MRPLIILLVVISLAANGVLWWANREARDELATISGDVERFQTQIEELSQELRAARAENQQLRERLGPGAPAAPAASAPAPAPSAETVADLRRIEENVVRLRGLAQKAEVPLDFLNHQQLREYFLRSFERDYTPEERERDRKLLTLLGLVPASMNLAEFMIELLQEQVIGFYDDESKRMSVIGEGVALGPNEKITFAHEFTHALQDQHFGLEALNPPNPDNDDRAMAIHALIEGDATLLMGLWANQELTPREMDEASRSDGSSDKLRQAPLVIRTELLFPYADGLRFVQRLHNQGGFAAVDRAFRDPPASTEQVLHPEKYTRREDPVPIDLPATETLLGPGWSDVVSNTLGELDLRILVEQYTDRVIGSRAATGWGGDRYRLAEDANGRLAFVLRTAWDTPNDADEFHTALAQSLRRRFNLPDGGIPKDAPRQLMTAASQPSLVSKRESEVILVMAPDEATLNRLAAALGH